MKSGLVTFFLKRLFSYHADMSNRAPERFLIAFIPVFTRDISPLQQAMWPLDSSTYPHINAASHRGFSGRANLEWGIYLNFFKALLDAIIVKKRWKLKLFLRILKPLKIWFICKTFKEFSEGWLLRSWLISEGYILERFRTKQLLNICRKNPINYCFEKSSF